MIMSGNNYVDKAYLALELTKIAYPSDKVHLDSDNLIYTTFQYFLKKLIDIEDFAVIDDYKTKIEQLTTKCSQLEFDNNQLKLSIGTPFRHRINSVKKYINDNGGNMEPDVKTQLLKMLDSIFD